MKLFFRKFLVYAITAVLVVPSWLVTSYLTADTAMASGPAPTVVNVTSTTADGAYKAGDVIDVSVQFSAAVDVVGVPKMTLKVKEVGNTSNAFYQSGSGADILHFAYTVATDDNSSHLNYYASNSLSLVDSSIKDLSGVDAVKDLPSVGAINSLASNKNIVIDTTHPSLTISGFTADGSVDMAGTLETGYTLNKQNTAASHTIQFKTGSVASESLKAETFGLYLAPTAGQTDALVDYYKSKDELYKPYLNAAAAGTKPFAYIKGYGNTTIRLLDGAQKYLAGTETDMIIPDAYPAGTYTVSGDIKDLAGNSKTVTFVLKVVSTDSVEAAFDSISSQLAANGISSNLGDVDFTNYTNFKDLYFEKSVDGMKLGRITFTSTFDLSKPETKTFLEGLGSKLDMSNGKIGFNATASDFAGVSAKIQFYNLDKMGLPAGVEDPEMSDLINARLIARDDSGNIIPIQDLISLAGTYVGTVGACGVGENICHTFTINVNHFTKYEIDLVAPVVTLNGASELSINLNSTYLELGATATDNVDKTVIATTSDKVDTTKAGVYTLIYTAEDSAGNKGTATRKVTVLKPTQVVATSGMTVTTPTEIVVPNGYAESMDIKVTTGGTTLNLAPSLKDGKDAAGVANKSAEMKGSTKISSEISSGNTVVVEMASGTTVTGPATWDGVIKLPEVTVNPTSVTVNSGNYPTNVASIEIGMPDVKLTFDKAVRILIPSAANRSVGYTRSDVFAPINTVCPADKQSDVDESMKLLPEGDCKINSADGKDLVIWTKHFTKFVTYDQALVTSPTFTAVVVDKDGAKYLDINWKGTGADSYKIMVNGSEIDTITGASNDLGLSYSWTRKVSEGIKYTVSMIAKKNGVESINNIATIVDVPAAVVVPQPEVISTPVASAPAPVTSVAPTKAKAAAPEEKKVETPKDADAGIVKGEDTDKEDANNWTPWIILFILILLAGAATGGYFYWFSDKSEAEVKVQTRVKGKTQEPVKTVEKQKETVKQTVQPAKKAEIAKPVQNAKPVQMASKKNHKKTKRW